MRTPPRISPQRSIWRIALWMLVAAAVIPTAMRVASLTSSFFARGWENHCFYDFRLWRGGVDHYVMSGELYLTKSPGYFLAGSVSPYKYPPTFAAILKLFAGKSQATVGREFFIGNLILLAASLAVLMLMLRPSPLRAAAMALVFVHWMPTWEFLSDLRMESIVLFLLSLSLLCLLRRKDWLGGVPIGVAGAFMVYPWLTLLPSVPQRRWKVLSGALLGAAAVLAACAIVLPARLTFQFFTQILPRLGGTSLSYENVSLMAQFGRLGLLLTGGLPNADALDPMHLEVHEIAHQALAHTIAIVLMIPVVLIAGGLVWRYMRAGSMSLERKDTLGYALMICAVLVFMPTSWFSYQILLIIPLLVLLAWAGSLRNDPITWLLLFASVAIGTTISGYGDFCARHFTTCSILRAALPLMIGAGLLRITALKPVPREGHAPLIGAD